MRSEYKGIKINTSKNTHEVVFSLLNKDLKSTIVDIPAGGGAFVQRLKDSGYQNILAIDIENLLEIDHDNFIIGDMTRTLELEEESCDSVVCIDGIEHINKQVDFVKEIYRVLKTKGEFIISTPNISSLRSRWKWLTTGHHHKCNSPLDENNVTPLHHIGMISFPELRYLLHTNGFRITHIKTNRIKDVSWIFMILLPIVYLATSMTYRKTGKKQNLRELNKSVFNQVFTKEVLYGETLIVKAIKNN
jgi:2-polyprenyl-3-methyl-5-hydroxy-6-metoxy-1,4-benzoquinol methylase